MEIFVTHAAPLATSLEVPEFPLVRFDTGMAVYQEALINGQYLAVNSSVMGRPKLREWIWKEFSANPAGPRPQPTRQHAFQLEVDGQLLADRWEWVGAHEVATERPTCREQVVVLRHTQRQISVEVHTSVDDTPFLRRWLVVTNTGAASAAISRISPWSGQIWEAVGESWHPLERYDEHTTSPFSIGRYTDSTAGAEGAFDWAAVPYGRFGFESMNGRSGWGLPFCFLRNDATGEIFLLDLAWSGNWQIELFNDYEPGRRPICDARLYAHVGLAGPAPLRVLAPGESAASPIVHFGCLLGDLDTCTQALHSHLRRSVLLQQPAGREHRVEVNHTGYTRNLQITESQLYEEIDIAADIGIELFLLDAGWFGAASDRWFEAVGDWDHESELLTNGVNAAFDRARERGMLCGLWVEAERMGATSQLLRDHPEWQMTRRGQPIPNLDLSKPEVADYLERTIIGLIEKYALDCFRLDYNISIGEGGEAERDGFVENVLWRHYEALYRIFDTIRKRFPQLLLENCSSGGGRNDMGMMARFHWTQISDLWAPAPTLKIVNGISLALPLELCETILGAISNGVADVDFMLRVGLFGHFCVSGIFPALAQAHSVARERWRHAITLYKDFVRPILSSCRVFHHTPIQRQRELGQWVVIECMSEDRGRGYTGIFRLADAPDDTYQLYPRGLDLGRRYKVSFDTGGWSRIAEGSMLAEQGLRVRVSGALCSELLLFEAL